MSWKICPRCNEQLRQIDSNNYICEEHGVYNISYLAGVRDGVKEERRKIVAIINEWNKKFREIYNKELQVEDEIYRPLELIILESSTTRMFVYEVCKGIAEELKARIEQEGSE